eukprot:9486152-Pyramimonas_sp.AAC.1
MEEEEEEEEVVAAAEVSLCARQMRHCLAFVLELPKWWWMNESCQGQERIGLQAPVARDHPPAARPGRRLRVRALRRHARRAHPRGGQETHARNGGREGS